jgi:hypothetical protein
MSDGIGIGEAIEALRAELEETVRLGANAPLRFGLSSIELELTAVLTTSANAKVGWKIIEVGGQVEGAHTQKVKVALTPQRRDEDGTYRTDFLVSGVLPEPVHETAPAGETGVWAPVDPGQPDT